jgi:hypothetical protein
MAFPRTRILLEPGTPVRVVYAAELSVTQSHSSSPHSPTNKVQIMVITAAHLTPWVAIIAGILILIMPRLLNFIVAIYLIFVGVVELNNVHHFFNWH